MNHQSALTHPKLQLAKTLAQLMDAAITIPGTKQKIGLDPLLGLFPVVGDVIGFAIALYIVILARQMGMSKFHLSIMMMNIILDSTLGAVPVVGDVFDVFWRANQRNVSMMEKFLVKHGHTKAESFPKRRVNRPASQQVIDVAAESLRADKF